MKRCLIFDGILLRHLAKVPTAQKGDSVVIFEVASLSFATKSRNESYMADAKVYIFVTRCPFTVDFAMSQFSSTNGEINLFLIILKIMVIEFHLGNSYQILCSCFRINVKPIIQWNLHTGDDFYWNIFQMIYSIMVYVMDSIPHA